MFSIHTVSFNSNVSFPVIRQVHISKWNGTSFNALIKIITADDWVEYNVRNGKKYLFLNLHHCKVLTTCGPQGADSLVKLLNVRLNDNVRNWTINIPTYTAEEVITKPFVRNFFIKHDYFRYQNTNLGKFFSLLKETDSSRTSAKFSHIKSIVSPKTYDQKSSDNSLSTDSQKGNHLDFSQTSTKDGSEKTTLPEGELVQYLLEHKTYETAEYINRIVNNYINLLHDKDSDLDEINNATGFYHFLMKFLKKYS